MERVKNVRDTIYLLFFPQPRYALEVSKMIYGHGNNRVFSEIRGLLKDNWIQECSIDIEIEDRRAEKRKYYLATPDPVIKYVQDTAFKLLFIEHSEKDLNFLKYFLRQLLSSRAFRYWVEMNMGKSIPKDVATKSLNMMDFILTFVDMLFIIHGQNDFFKRRLGAIKNKGDYDRAIDKLSKLKKEDPLKKKLQEMMPLFYWDTTIEDKKDEIMSDFHYLFVIPEIELGPFKFSEFGSKYHMTESLSQDISKIL
jgi:hypothetical protein